MSIMEIPLSLLGMAKKLSKQVFKGIIYDKDGYGNWFGPHKDGANPYLLNGVGWGMRSPPHADSLNPHGSLITSLIRCTSYKTLNIYINIAWLNFNFNFSFYNKYIFFTLWFFKLNFIYYNNIYSLHYEVNILLLGNYIKRLYKSECETNKMKFLIKGWD